MADFLAEQEFGIALSIRLRRFAVWGSITSLPDHKPDGETLLRGMQADRVKDYQDQLRHPDLALWRKVEQSLTMAPYWFEGQWMSYTIAQQLGKSDWCQAIAEETQQFYVVCLRCLSSNSKAESRLSAIRSKSGWRA